MSIPGLCRVWTRFKDPANPYWSRMTYPARDYDSCVRLVEYYSKNWPNREYLITEDSDLMQPLAKGPAPLSEDLAWRCTAT